MLSQLPDGTYIGFLSSLRVALELKTLDHSLSEFGHSYTSGLICLVANRSVVDLTFRSRMIELFSGGRRLCAQRLVQPPAGPKRAIQYHINPEHHTRARSAGTLGG